MVPVFKLYSLGQLVTLGRKTACCLEFKLYLNYRVPHDFAGINGCQRSAT